MAESEDGQERTQEPTPKRLQEAKEKGQVPRSKELGSALALMAAATAFLTMGGYFMDGLTDEVSYSLDIERAHVFDESMMLLRFKEVIFETLWLLAPFFGLMMGIGVLSAIALGGWSFSTQAIAFKPEKLDPVKGIGRIFGFRGLMEAAKAIAKFGLVTVGLVLFLQANAHAFLGLGAEPAEQSLAHMGNLVAWAFLVLSLIMLILVAVDVPFQLWDHQRQLKMTQQEVKEEHKQTEGSPEVKGKQRQIQQEMAQRRMMEEVPEADVVVTNPSHYSVALRYDQEAMDAPVVVAKGAGEIAMQIRRIAREHQVPILETPPLARALYHSTELDDRIPAGLYRAVAQVLAYVYHLRQGPVYNRSGGISLDDLPIPDELRRDE